MIDKNKYQCWQHPMIYCLLLTINVNSMNKNKSLLKKKHKYSGKKEWVLKTDMNSNNNKINNCSKQISMLTKTKLLITEQKTNGGNTQMNDS